MKALILGDVRSGKSRLAEAFALRSGLPVTHIATALPGDKEMRQRIEAHCQRRPPSESWEIGASGEVYAVRWSLSGYYTELDDLIAGVFDPATCPPSRFLLRAEHR